MEKVKFGIVGVGGIGTAHGRAMIHAPDVEIVALCDIIPERMETFAEELDHPVNLYEDYRDLCQDPEVEAVFVGTPNQVHVPVAIEVMKNDKHVLCTKPLSSSLQAAEQAVEVAESTGVVNMMSMMMRFGDPVQYLGSLRDTFGELYYARARSIRRSGIPDWNVAFIEEGGGAFRDMGVHVLDAVWWLLGKPKPVAVMGVAGAKFGPRGLGYWDFRTPEQDYIDRYAADDYAGGIIRFENGTGLQVESFWASHQAPDRQIELFGTEGGAKLEPLTLYRTVNGRPQDISVEIERDPHSLSRIIFGHFVDCVRNGVECEAPLRHGFTVQRMMEAMLESGQTGDVVYLD